MARGSLNFFELHVEKIVLGGVIAFAIYVFVTFFVMTPNEVDYAGRKVTPSTLTQAILEQARNLDNKVRNAQPEDAPLPNLAAELQNEFRSGILRTTGNAPAIPPTLVQTAPFGPPLPELGEQSEQTDVTLITPMPPEAPVVATGRAVVVAKRPVVAATPDRGGAAGDADSATVERAWVTVAAWYSIDAQRNEMTKAGYPPFRSSVILTGVEAQRQELKASGEWSDWEDVTRSEAMPQFDIPPAVIDSTGLVANKAELDEIYKVVRASPVAIVQPKFYETRSGDFWRLPPLEGITPEMLAAATDLPTTAEPPAPAPGERPAGERPGAGDRPAAGGGLGGGRGAREDAGAARRERNARLAEKLNQAEEAFAQRRWADAKRLAEELLAERPAAPSQMLSAANRLIERSREGAAAETLRTMTDLLEHPTQKDKVAIWFHDDSVEPGKTYRYRIRPTLWNRYVGRVKAVKDPEDAKKTVLRGEWSLPSAPIAVAPTTHFFVSNANVNDGQARVDVFRWQNGSWKHASFDVGVGETIGGIRRDGDGTIDFSTGALVLDIQPIAEAPQRVRQGKQSQFIYLNRPSVLLTYLDPADTRVRQTMFDKSDPAYVRMREAAD
jgi:hypothetical protein